MASDAANAEVVTRCGASAGYAYYPESALVPKDKAGWRRDTVAGGSLQLIRDGANFDVVYTDSSGGTRSARSDGFQVFPVPGTPPTRHLLLGVHPTSGVVEHWLFDIDAAGRGSVIWGTVRGGTKLPKSGLMEARCNGP